MSFESTQRAGYPNVAHRLMYVFQVASAADLPDFVQLVKASSTAVVNINAVRQPPTSDERGQSTDSPVSPFPEGSPFDELLRRYFGDRLPMPQPGRDEGLAGRKA